MKKLLAVLICAAMLFSFASPAFAATVTKISLESIKAKIIFDKVSDGIYCVKDSVKGFEFQSSLSDEDRENFLSDWNAFVTGSTERIAFIGFTIINSHIRLWAYDAGECTLVRKTSSYSGTTYYTMAGGNSRVWQIQYANHVGSMALYEQFYVIKDSLSLWPDDGSSGNSGNWYYRPPENFIPFNYKEISETLDFASSSLFPKTAHTLTINYQYTDGSQAAEPVTQSLDPGAAYSIPSPTVPGYTPDKPTVTGTMPDSDHTETVTYSPTTYQLTIHYRYENGAEAAPSHMQQLAPGAEYAVDSPVLDDCIASLLTVTGTMPEEDVTLTVTYTSTMYPLTIHYRYTGGLQAAGSITRLLAAGAEYSIPSPAISGYTADQPVVSGTMPAEGLTVTVIYTRNSSGGGTGPGGGGSDPFDSPAWWQDFSDPFQSPPLWQDFRDPFAKIFGRLFSDVRGDDS